MIDPAIIRSRDPIPFPAFDKHFKDALDHDPGPLEGRLAMTDVRVHDDVLSEFLAFARFYEGPPALRIITVLPRHLRPKHAIEIGVEQMVDGLFEAHGRAGRKWREPTPFWSESIISVSSPATRRMKSFTTAFLASNAGCSNHSSGYWVRMVMRVLSGAMG